MKDFREGFDRVMTVVCAQHKARTGSERGASSWLAAQLKISRQTINNYQKRKGFPYRYAKKLMRLTGLAESEIWPDGITVEACFSTETWNDIIDYAQRAGRSPAEIVVELVKIGLKSRSKHG